MVGVENVMSLALGAKVTIYGQTVEINMSEEALRLCLQSFTVNATLMAAGITIVMVGGTYVVNQFGGFVGNVKCISMTNTNTICS